MLFRRQQLSHTVANPQLQCSLFHIGHDSAESSLSFFPPFFLDQQVFRSHCCYTFPQSLRDIHQHFSSPSCMPIMGYIKLRAEYKSCEPGWPCSSSSWLSQNKQITQSLFVSLCEMANFSVSFFFFQTKQTWIHCTSVRNEGQRGTSVQHQQATHNTDRSARNASSAATRCEPLHQRALYYSCYPNTKEPSRRRGIPCCLCVVLVHLSIRTSVVHH